MPSILLQENETTRRQNSTRRQAAWSSLSAFSLLTLTLLHCGLLRYREVFQAACANSAVTDWRNSSTIYAERHMWIPQENQTGYAAARVMNCATNLQGRLLSFFGTADHNTHPANSLQLIAARQEAEKSFEVQVGPDEGHTGVWQNRMMEFFMQNLVVNKPPKYRPPTKPAQEAEDRDPAPKPER